MRATPMGAPMRFPTHFQYYGITEEKVSHMISDPQSKHQIGSFIYHFIEQTD